MSFPLALLIPCQTLEEAKAAWNAIQVVRAGGSSPPASGGEADPEAALAERIAAALHKAPMNRPKEIVLRQLLAAAPQAWVAYPDMQAALSAEGLEPERAAAALRDLSGQMGEHLPPQDTAGFGRKIEVLAERTRAGGVYRYRLTKRA